MKLTTISRRTHDSRATAPPPPSDGVESGWASETLERLVTAREIDESRRPRS